MLIYENSFPSTYEEIKTWYPVWYREVFEMDAIWQVFGGQMDRIQADLIRMVENNFIEFADAPTVTRLESFFGIIHPFPRTLVERRAVLIGFVRGRGHIGRPRIIEIISLFTSGEIDVAFSRPGKIDVTVTRDFGDMFNLADIHLILGHRIPAHLTLGVIDLPRPVSVRNHNDFILRSLFMLLFRIANITAPLFLLNGEYVLDGYRLFDAGVIHGKNFIDFHVAIAVRNYGTVDDNLLLDGRPILDGIFLLNGRKHAPLRGISARQLDLSVFKIINKFSMSNSICFSAIRARNTSDFQAYRLDIKANIINSRMGLLLDGNWSKRHNLLNGLSMQWLNLGVYKLNTNSRLGSGTLAKSTTWHLNGQLKLDSGNSAGGVQTLKKLIIKEVL